MRMTLFYVRAAHDIIIIEIEAGQIDTIIVIFLYVLHILHQDNYKWLVKGTIK